jgi:hypothetical protein
MNAQDDKAIARPVDNMSVKAIDVSLRISESPWNKSFTEQVQQFSYNIWIQILSIDPLLVTLKQIEQISGERKQA